MSLPGLCLGSRSNMVTESVTGTIETGRTTCEIGVLFRLSGA